MCDIAHRNSEAVPVFVIDAKYEFLALATCPVPIRTTHTNIVKAIFVVVITRLTIMIYSSLMIPNRSSTLTIETAVVLILINVKNISSCQQHHCLYEV